MTEHLHTPPCVAADFVAAFNTAWLDGASLGHASDLDVVLDCGTLSSDAMISLCNEYELSGKRPSLEPYLRVGAAPRDHVFAGRPFLSILDGHVDDAMAQWRVHAGHDAMAASAFFRQHELAAHNSALRRWREELMAQVNNPSRAEEPPVPLMAMPVARLRPPVPPEILRAVPTADAIRTRLRERWGTAAFLGRSGGLAFAGQPLRGSDETMRTSTMPESVSRAPVPGAQAAPLRANAIPRPCELPGGAVAAPQMVYHVIVYHSAQPRRDQEYLVLGSHSLDTLCDRIYCPSDLQAPESTARHSASYLYVEGVLFDDRRRGRDVSPLESEDPRTSLPVPSRSREKGHGVQHPRYLSDEVTAWSRDALEAGRSSGWGLLRSGSMSATTFDALSPRLGAHYVYTHRGNCQHIVVFADARLLSALPGHDVLDAGCYPRHIVQVPLRRRICMACGRAKARHEVYGSALAADNPSRLCDACHDLLHCDADGRVTFGEATVLPYLHD